MELFGEKPPNLLSKLVSAVQLTDPESFVSHVPGIEAYGKKFVWLKLLPRNVFPLLSVVLSFFKHCPAFLIYDSTAQKWVTTLSRDESRVSWDETVVTKSVG